MTEVEVEDPSASLGPQSFIGRISTAMQARQDKTYCPQGEHQLSGPHCAGNKTLTYTVMFI